MSSEPATATAAPAGQAFGCTVQGIAETLCGSELAPMGSRRRDTQPALSDLPFPASPAPRSPAVVDALHRVTMSARPFPGARARGRAHLACPAFRQEARAVGRPQLSRRNAHSGAVLRATHVPVISAGLSQAWRLLGGSVPPHLDAAALRAWSRTWMDQGRDGISPRTGPGRNLAEHRDPRFWRRTRRRGGPSPRTGLSSGRAVARFAARY